jgi:hypothetical protein
MNTVAGELGLVQIDDAEARLLFRSFPSDTTWCWNGSSFYNDGVGVIASCSPLFGNVDNLNSAHIPHAGA